MTRDELLALPPGTEWTHRLGLLDPPLLYLRWDGVKLRALHGPHWNVVFDPVRSQPADAYLEHIDSPPPRAPWSPQAALATARYLEQLP